MSMINPTNSLSKERETDIIGLAESISDEYCLNEQIDLSLILKKKGITISFNHYGDSFDGLLEFKEGNFHIYCNLKMVETETSPRAFFTISHELGHYFIDEHRNALISGVLPSHSSFCDHESNYLIEREADLFASHLLMPQSRFLKKAKKETKGLSGILKISDFFNVSVTSCAIRYVKSNFLQSAILLWRNEGLKWKWLSPSLHEIGLRKTIESVGAMPSDCSTKCLLELTDRVSKNNFLKNGTTAKSWFPFLNENDTRNNIWMEEAISLGKWGILTFLSEYRTIF